MSRKDNLKSGVKNPATKFLEWKSSEKAFQYWDKEKKENVTIKLPLKFIYLDDYTTIKGFSKGKNAGLVSNEVKFVDSEKLRFGFFDNGKIKILAEGYYKDIKPKIVMEGGKFTKSVYALSPKGELFNLQLNGSGLGNWFDFIKKNKKKLFNHFVKVEKTSIEKNGSIEYNAPVYEVGESVPDELLEKSEQAYNEVLEYYESYKQKNADNNTGTPEQDTKTPKQDTDVDDDLPF